MQTLLILVFIPFILADVNKFMFQGQSPLSLNSLNPGNKIMNEHSVAEPGLIGPYSTLYNLTMDVIQHGQNKFAGIDPSILIPIQNILSDSDYEIKISFPSWAPCEFGLEFVWIYSTNKPGIRIRPTFKGISANTSHRIVQIPFTVTLDKLLLNSIPRSVFPSIIACLIVLVFSTYYFRVVKIYLDMMTNDS